MKKMTIYYGSTTGTCETLASSIAQALGMSNDNVRNRNDQGRSGE